MHVAIIMDGNGRWAQRRGLPRTAGHRVGADAVDRAVTAAARHGVDVLTLYAFSCANWQRPLAEVRGLFRLFRSYLENQTQRCLEQSIRLNVIGRRDRLDPRLLELIEHSEKTTEQCSRMILRIAVDYSAQWGLMRASRISSDRDLDHDSFARQLATINHSVPVGDVDLLIRTGGEYRLSDFMLWECAYAELYFTPLLWPEFDADDFEAALLEYTRRDRRYGRIDESTADSARAHHA
ncbi:di-trans,poly-cis-decaprenylcistransferase [Steroidobacter sp. S1-65]|uniref:Ditrans,polycis-undecaprenyl-diphosphate synthase ((2E,6E)-farnesyl-diphosphate specific) n=1 Tax=Steroidobacter gossypii TaxID=2805490 RepID=A0ABS1WQY5_9GAMM|nr:polyprenyl diphosphate synthase [Steroidobacter gossypii]MBM0103395.1 di-trans,poly-cis-decaprenylcistransferase [Steroidobacter gossypii]